jgi:hypothetical protein
MTKQTIEDALARSNPWTPSDGSTLRSTVDQISAESRVAAISQKRRRAHNALWILPTAGAVVIALTAGAVVTDNLLHVNLPISIAYTTDTGAAVTCTVHIEGGSLFAPVSNEVINYYQHHDFTGVGQKVYNYALVLAGDRPVSAGVLPKSSRVVPAAGGGYDDRFAFTVSLNSFLLGDTDVDLGIQGSGDEEMKSDCTGQLH